MKHFKELEKNVREKLLSDYNDDGFALASVLGYEIISSSNRSTVFEVYQNKYILKWLKGSGKSDYDIEALLNLDGIKYFPKLYAYKEREYLLMKKAKGVNLLDLTKKELKNNEIKKIKTQLLDAYTQMINRGYEDWDFKLEHVFWDIKYEKLTWIDLGVCEKYNLNTPTNEERIKSFEKKFEEKLQNYGFKY